MFINFTKSGAIVQGKTFSVSDFLIDKNFIDTKTANSIIGSTIQNISNFPSEFNKIIPENLGSRIESLSINDDINHSITEINWDKSKRTLISGSVGIGKTNTLKKLIENSPFENLVIFTTDKNELSFDSRTVFVSEEVTSEIMDKVAYFVDLNPNTAVIVDNIDSFINREALNFDSLLAFKNLLVTTNNQNVSEKIINQFNSLIYLGDYANSKFKKYKIPNSVGRGVIFSGSDEFVVQFGLFNTNDSLFIQQSENKLNILPEKILSEDLSSNRGNQFGVGLNYFSNEQTNLSIDNGEMNIVLLNNEQQSLPIISSMKKQFNNLYYLDIDGYNWVIKNQISNYVTNPHDIPQFSKVIISNLESLIQKYKIDDYRELLQNSGSLIFSNSRYFNHSFDPELQFFKQNITNKIEFQENSNGKQTFALLNNDEKVLMAS
jgi:hypothetical protein